MNTGFDRGSCATALALVWLVTFGAVAVASDGELPSASEVRERRLIRGEDPLWRRAVALPAVMLRWSFWPLQQTIFWMERDAVPERIKDAVTFPARLLRGEDDAS